MWEKADTTSIQEIGDLEGYKSDFYNLFGFGFDDVDYQAEADENVVIDEVE